MRGFQTQRVNGNKQNTRIGQLVNGEKFIKKDHSRYQ